MTAAMALPGHTAKTFLVHFFGTGLTDDRYVIELYRAHADGEILPARVEATAVKAPAQVQAHNRHADGGSGDASGTAEIII